MVIKTTTWTLDTCGCTVEYDWDDNGNDQEDKVHTFKQVDHVCGSHVDVDTQLGHQALYDKIKEENVRKNKVYKAFVENIADVAEDKVQEDGTIVRALKPGIDFTYIFTGSPLDVGGRMLEIEFRNRSTNTKKPITPGDKTAAQAKMTANGIDLAKVLIK